MASPCFAMLRIQPSTVPSSKTRIRTVDPERRGVFSVTSAWLAGRQRAPSEFRDRLRRALNLPKVPAQHLQQIDLALRALLESGASTLTAQPQNTDILVWPAHCFQNTPLKGLLFLAPSTSVLSSPCVSREKRPRSLFLGEKHDQHKRFCRGLRGHEG